MAAVFDLDNPNLDGDFKALKKLREDSGPITHNYKPPARNKLTTAEEEEEDTSQSTSVINLLGDEKNLQKDLFAAAEKNDVEKVRQLCRKVMELNLSIANPTLRKSKSGATALHQAVQHNLVHLALRDPSDKATVLHHALKCKATDVAKYLIENGDLVLLVDEFDVSIGSMPSKKTALHLLAEQNKIELANLLLDNIRELSVRMEYMDKKTSMSVEGQRPRDFSAIHIACLHGYTGFVTMLLGRGVNVNTMNVKSDTPILWASRFNKIDTVRSLIANKADPNMENDKGSTPLYWAVRYGYPEMVKVLIEEGKANIHQERKLGLVCPIVLAATLGYLEIAKILLQHGARVNTTITGGRTALHLAASYGHEHVVETLLDFKANIDAEDDNGNSALMYATMEGNVDCMNVLLGAGADIMVKNKKGETIWDFVMYKQDTFLIESLISMYKTVKRLKGRKLTFPPGRTPLHVCALQGDANKLQLLLDLGVNRDCLDQNKNTFYHIAARENKVDILEHYQDTVNLSEKNSDGETALHLAARNGSIDALSILLKKAKLDVTNTLGETPLHVAASSHKASTEVVAKIVNVVVNAHNWSLVDAQDKEKNTALHHAAHAGRKEVIEALSPLNPKLLNAKGDSPLHVAAKKSASAPDLLHTMLAVFNRPEKGLDINQPKADGETLLHIAAKRGEADQVHMLIETGADLGAQDEEGHTVLHDLIHKSTETPHNEELMQVFHTIIGDVVWWWCNRKDSHVPDEDSVPYRKYQCAAILYLTQQITNSQNLSVISYATHIGATDMLQAMFNIDHVYRFKEKGIYFYDVTYLTTETKHKPSDKTGRRSGQSSRSTVGILEEPNYAEEDKEDIIVEETKVFDSCLEILVKMENEVLATKMLDVHPLKELVANFWATYQWIYALLMVLHIVYMSCLTAYAIPYTSESLHPNVTAAEAESKIFPQVLFLLWPALILLFEVYYLMYLLMRCVREHRNQGNSNATTASDKSKDNNHSKGKQQETDMIRSLRNFYYWVFDNNTTWGGLLFSFSVIAWFILYVNDVFDQVYLLAVTLIVGWMFTIAFTKGFETVHAFSIMLKYIIVNDITRFLFLYSFILLGFGFAMHALFQISPAIAVSYPTAWHSLFTTFNMMIGMDEIFDENTDSDYEDNNSSSIYVRLVYLLYILMSTIIMLNLLIAMMSDTYNQIKLREGTTWRVASVRMALHIEKSLPFVPHSLKAMKLVKSRIMWDEMRGRWLLPVDKDSITWNDTVEDQHTHLMYRLEGKINHLTNIYNDMARQVEELTERYTEIARPQSARVGAGGEGRPRITKRASTVTTRA